MLGIPSALAHLLGQLAMAAVDSWPWYAIARVAARSGQPRSSATDTRTRRHLIPQFQRLLRPALHRPLGCLRPVAAPATSAVK